MKITLGLASLLIITALILGGIIAYSAFPREVTVTKTVIEPGPVVEKEVIKEVEVAPNYKQQVADALMDEVSSDKDFRECSGDEYETDEISIKKVYDGFTVKENTDGDIAISGVKIKLNYDDGDCYESFTCGLDAEGDLSC